MSDPIIPDILNELQSRIDEQFDKKRAGLLNQFVTQFYSAAATEDLALHHVGDLLGASLSVWNNLQDRDPNQAVVRVYNPEYEKNGWNSTHTVVEIIQDEMPFLMDSIIMAINRMGSTPQLIVQHGAISFIRDESGNIKEILEPNDESEGDHIESAVPILIEIERQTDPNWLIELEKALTQVLEDVQVCVDDWASMRQGTIDIVKQLHAASEYLDKDELAESISFLEWINNNHFTFLGVRDYKLTNDNGEKVLKTVPKTGLGVLRVASKSWVSRRLVDMTPEARELTLSSQILIISKSNTLSTVHRPTYTDYIGVKLFNQQGEVIGERRIIGLYTSISYNTTTIDIPLMRRKVQAVLKRSKLKLKSHAGKTLLNIIDTLPRDDVFHATEDELLDLSMGIFHLQERRRISLFARRDVFGRFISVLVFVPRERFNTELREEIQRALLKFFGGSEVAFSTLFSESVLARIHFVVRFASPKHQQFDLTAIEQEVTEIGRSWDDDLKDYLIEHYGEAKGVHYSHKYAHAFPLSYREYYRPRTAVYDIQHIEEISPANVLEMNLYRPPQAQGNEVRFKVFRKAYTIPLSDVLPILENLGLRVISERPYQINIDNKVNYWINDFGMDYAKDAKFDYEQVKYNFQDAFRALWLGHAENDSFNKLVLTAGLGWHEVGVIRAYAKYMLQLGFTFSQSYIEQTINRHPSIARDLFTIFDLKFNPKLRQNEQRLNELTQRLIEKLDLVDSLDEDRILRRYIELVDATVRTNFYLTDDSGSRREYISFKIQSAILKEIPKPVPLFEIFVYSPKFEGIHLRSAKVARGGLRWSDRREDFRTEVLGLMKAQVVKNAVIVPAGAKGGFVPKANLNALSREEVMAEGVACYQNFIRGLLDITDNRVGNDVIAPENVVRYDEDDPYLVVAADKGTATFSDIANKVAEEYQFWLGDAFASGGSTGYDHKKIGITARGAWESVKRHFREFGHNSQTEDFTVIGIGDMAGDVFGNGMLLSKHIRLLSAFNHQHIFIDPNPDSAISYKERKRLFELSRSSWTDYDAKLISKGGGIFSRSDKSIDISPEMQKAFAITETKLEPNALIRAVLCAPVDLLWNGGIGTFIKGEQERDDEVGDRTNDCIRVNANEVKVKVIGEGGNLGLTQLGRVEFASNGGYIFTDFIDNSAGVDCSDHEVNIKILLNQIVDEGDLTEKQRNQLLSDMTDEVAHLVLQNNYRQTLAISLAADQARRNIQLHNRYIKELEKKGHLDRALEFLPEEEVLLERLQYGKGLLRPGIAVLLAYSKTLLKEQILDSEVTDERYFCDTLKSAFPTPLRERYFDQMKAHRLRREIIATQLANAIINAMGFTFIYRLHDETGAPVSAIVRAYTVVSHIFELDKIWAGIEALDNKVPTEIQHKLLLTTIRLIRRSTRWLLRHRRSKLSLDETIDYFYEDIKTFQSILPGVLAGDELSHFNEIYEHFISVNVPKDLAKILANSRALMSALDIVESAKINQFSIEDVAAVYFKVGDELSMDWIRGEVIAHEVHNHWEGLSRESLRDDLDWQQRKLAISILQHNLAEPDPDARIQSWTDRYSQLVNRWHELIKEMKQATQLNFTIYFVAIRELLDLTQTSLQTVKNQADTPLIEKPKKVAEGGAKR